MIKGFAICNETWRDLSYGATCRRIRLAGYDAVEIAPFTLARSGPTVDKWDRGDRGVLCEITADAGLRIAGLHWLLVPPPDGLHLTTDDGPTRQRTADYLAHLADFCADVGGEVLILGSPKQRNVAPGTTYADAFARYLETITPCLDICAARGVVLCPEPLGPDETNFLTTLAEARTVIAASGSAACRTIFDVKAAATEGVPLPDLIAANADIIAHVHANDANRRGPGFGDTAFAPIMAALKEINYGGWVSVEVFDYSPDPDTVARVSLETLKAAQGDK